MSTLWASAAGRSFSDVPPSLEEVVYDLARAALEDQRDLVAGLRSRARRSSPAPTP